MTVFSARANVVIGTTMGVSGLWLVAVPRLVSNSMFAVFAALLISGVGVSYVTWRNAQAPESVGQLLYETEVAPSTGRAASKGIRK